MHRQTTFGEIEPSFIGPGKEDDGCIVVSNEIVGELLRITPQKEVISPSIEHASEAGRAFVAAIRSALAQQDLERAMSNR